MPVADVLSFEELEVGRTVSVEATIREADLDAFAVLSGDYNPLHMDANFAASRQHRGRVVHGLLLASVLSRIVGMRLPGRDCLLESVQLDFIKPAYAGETIRAAAEVTQLQPAMRAVSMRVRLMRGDELIARGRLLAVFDG